MARRFIVVAFLVGATRVGAQANQPSTSAPISRTPAQVTIVGSDYAFLRAPTTLPAGETLFAFENRGKVRHEFSLGLLKPGVTVQDVLNVVTQVGRRRNLIESPIGLLIANPSDTSGGRLLVRLIPGRSYVVICTLKDKPDAQPHAALGMIGGFTVPLPE
jgi:hypothetical protein